MARDIIDLKLDVTTVTQSAIQKSREVGSRVWIDQFHSKSTVEAVYLADVQVIVSRDLEPRDPLSADWVTGPCSCCNHRY